MKSFLIQLLFGDHWTNNSVELPDSDAAWAMARALRRDLGALAVTVRAVS